MLGPLGGVLEDHHPPIARERKALSNCLLEYDAARNKLARAREATASVTDAGAATERVEREERLATELADVEAKLNNCRENVETLMLQFIAKEVGETYKKPRIVAAKMDLKKIQTVTAHSQLQNCETQLGRC